MRHKSNSELMEWLNDRPYLRKRQFKPKNIVVFRSTRRRLHDRLTEKDIANLIVAFKTGTAKYVLAERYGINIKSVKKLLREHGVKRRSRWDRVA